MPSVAGSGNDVPLAPVLRTIGFFLLEEQYRVRREADGTFTIVSDLPSRITMVVNADQKKSILNYFAGSEKLEQFEQLIDELTGSAHWIGELGASSF